MCLYLGRIHFEKKLIWVKIVGCRGGGNSLKKIGLGGVFGVNDVLLHPE
jgi:hypothetical protein